MGKKEYKPNIAFSEMVEEVQKSIVRLSPPNNKEGARRLEHLKKNHLAIYTTLAEKLVSGGIRYIKDLVELSGDELNETDTWQYEDLCCHVFGVLLSDKLEKDIRDRSVAYFVQALILCGSSRIRAIQSTAIWMAPEIKSTAVRTCHEKYRKLEKKEFALDAQQFICGNGWHILDSILARKHDVPFPKTPGKTRAAYDRLRDTHQRVRKERPRVKKPFSFPRFAT